MSEMPIFKTAAGDEIERLKLANKELEEEYANYVKHMTDDISAANKEIEQLKKENESMQGSIGALVAICKNRSAGVFSAPIPNYQIIEMLEKHVKP